MLYVLAILLPPFAVLFTGKPVRAVLNFFLCLLFWIPGIIHALFVVSQHYKARRDQEFIAALSKQGY